MVGGLLHANTLALVYMLNALPLHKYSILEPKALSLSDVDATTATATNQQPAKLLPVLYVAVSRSRHRQINVRSVILFAGTLSL